MLAKLARHELGVAQGQDGRLHEPAKHAVREANCSDALEKDNAESVPERHHIHPLGWTPQQNSPRADPHRRSPSGSAGRRHARARPALVTSIIFRRLRLRVSAFEDRVWRRATQRLGRARHNRSFLEVPVLLRLQKLEDLGGQLGVVPVLVRVPLENEKLKCLLPRSDVLLPGLLELRVDLRLN